MKRYTIIFIICLLTASMFASTSSPASALYSESYLQRSEGVNAMYWNPSRLFLNKESHGDMILLSTNGNFWNNTMDIDQYNKMVDDTLSIETRREFIRSIDGNRFSTKGSFHGIILAWSQGKDAYAVSTHAFANARISRQYFDLLFTGNELDKSYYFDRGLNDMDMIAYGDLSIAHGGYPLHDYIARIWDVDLPKIYGGFTISALFGGGFAEMKEFKGSFMADSTSLSLDQLIRVRYGVGGVGLKGLVGITVEELVENLSLGFTIDNLPGFISWNSEVKEKYYHIHADNVDVSDMNSDTIENEESTKNGDAFTTNFPILFNLGANYTFDENSSVSFDWSQAVENSVVASDKPFISLAGEYIIAEMFPFRIGTAFDTEYDTYSVTYSIGYKNRKLEIDYALQSYEQIFPTESAKGTGYSLQLKFIY